jgi:hypothetical protein
MTEKARLYKVVGPSKLNVRDAPSMQARIVGTLLPLELIVGLGKTITDTPSGNVWVRHARGYSMYIDKEGTNAGAGNIQQQGMHFLLRV